MKELDPLVFAAVLHEMLGPWLWALLALAALVAAGLAAGLVRDGGLVRRRLRWAALAGAAGGVAGVLAVLMATESGIADIGGAIDVLLAAAIWLAGALAVTIGAYVAMGVLGGGRPAGR